jgi:hypothetical protein
MDNIAATFAMSIDNPTPAIWGNKRNSAMTSQQHQLSMMRQQRKEAIKENKAIANACRS